MGETPDQPHCSASQHCGAGVSLSHPLASAHTLGLDHRLGSDLSSLLTPGKATPFHQAYLPSSAWGHFHFKKVCFFFSSVTQSCPTLCNPMNHSTPGFPVHHQLREFAQNHLHRVGNAIQPPHPLLSSSPPAFNLSLQSFFFFKIKHRYRKPHGANTYLHDSDKATGLPCDHLQVKNRTWPVTAEAPTGALSHSGTAPPSFQKDPDF